MLIHVAWFLFYWEPEREARSFILLIQRLGAGPPLAPLVEHLLYCNVWGELSEKSILRVFSFSGMLPPAQPELFVCYHCDMQSQAAIQQQTRTTYNWERVGENYSFCKNSHFIAAGILWFQENWWKYVAQCTLLNKWKMKSTRLKRATNFKGFLTKIEIRGNWTNCAKKRDWGNCMLC